MIPSLASRLHNRRDEGAIFAPPMQQVTYHHRAGHQDNQQHGNAEGLRLDHIRCNRASTMLHATVQTPREMQYGPPDQACLDIGNMSLGGLMSVSVSRPCHAHCLIHVIDKSCTIHQ